ncbi:MAG: glycosyl hydrolase [Chlorobi bacterium]|nr:glycosyl hydrolase [Chlorobiota bacterium]
MKKVFFIVVLGIILAQGNSYTQEPPGVSSSTFGAISARQIGPARMSGRIAAIDAVESDPRIVYIGTASGGVWKSINGGTTCSPVFDKYVMSIGAIAIDQLHPDTVYVGTGEPWTRNSTSVGKGVFKTTDGGDNWEAVGLENTERIGRIVIHPEHPDTVFVAALGHLWDANTDRGLYRSTNGGVTWDKVLYVDENTGCSDVIILPDNPDVMFAAMWDFRRKAYTFRSGGPGSGLYKSTDGGTSWTKVTGWLPEGTIGRIALDVSPANPARIYALIEAKKSGLYRSDDHGETWKLTNKTSVVGERPFYFANIIADPLDTGIVYKPGLMLSVSKDGGKTFDRGNLMSFGGGVHSDLHAMWISPKNNNDMYLGTDGGVYVSNDQGKTWRILRNLPVSQFYHVSVDDQRPYHVYGGLQDNGSWTGPSAAPGGVTNHDWKNVGGGDGFYSFPDPDDPGIVYSQSQGGEINRLYLRSNEVKTIKPYADETTEDLRFNWNTPMVFGHSGALYIGAQYLYRSQDKGDSWERISPDLTTDDPAKQQQEKSGGITIDNTTAENHCTIITINESPLDPDIIWVGTDDGNLQLTRDGGKTWTNLTPKVPGLPPATWCSSVLASAYDAGTAYITFDGHRNGDMHPYIYKTTGFGSGWKSLVDENIEGYCHKILEDPVAGNLLFLGTEFGLYLSVDGGHSWARFTGNFPKVSVRDMVIQTRENDLVVATHGRGILILDDITPLRSITPDILDEEVAFLPSRPYVRSNQGSVQEFAGYDEFVGPNPPEAAMLTYFMRKRHIFGDMYIEVFGPDGEKIKTLPAGKRKGINRVAVNMRLKPPRVPTSRTLSFAGFFGPLMAPGEYTVKIMKNGKEYPGYFTVVDDPDLPYSAQDRALQQKTVMRAYNMLEDLAYLDRIITDVAKAASVRQKEKISKSLKKQLKTLQTSLLDIHKKLVATRSEGLFSSEEQLREKIAEIYGGVVSFMGRPTNSQINRLDVLQKEMESWHQKAAKLFSEDMKSVNQRLKKAGLKEITLITREDFNKENEEK